MFDRVININTVTEMYLSKMIWHDDQFFGISVAVSPELMAEFM